MLETGRRGPRGSGGQRGGCSGRTQGKGEPEGLYEELRIEKCVDGRRVNRREDALGEDTA